MSPTSLIINKLDQLERELQDLKLAVYRRVPGPKARASRYAERLLVGSARLARRKIWQKKYAKKMEGFS